MQPIEEEVINRGRVLSLEEQQSFIREFSPAEVKKTCFSIPDKKAPGTEVSYQGFLSLLRR